MTIKTDQFQDLLKARGHTPFHATKKKQGYKLRRDVTVYLNLASASGVTALIVRPDSGIEALLDKVTEMQIGSGYYHSSKLTDFPKRMHRGKNPISYGVGLTFLSEASAQACLNFLEGPKT